MAMAADNVTARKSPERIGRYDVIARLGRGAMGVVYQARDGAMGREVALKVLTADLEDDPEIRTRFLREAEAAARLSHPNIITIFDVGEDGDRFFIVMELLRGAILKDFLKQNEGLRLGRKLDLMMQLCAGLGAAHNASIYHRDIKPGNVFVRSDGLLKILDFGVARLSSSSMTAAGFIVGTPDYMSPEQARGDEIDGRSDIFSLGGVFYFMLTGRKPFPATALPTLFHQIQSEDPPPLGEDVPPELATIVMKALAKKRETRYQNCQELLADLELVKHLYSFDAIETELPAVIEQVAGGGGAVAAAGVVTPVVAAGDETPGGTTEDTVDFEPAGSSETEDTVTLSAPTWTSRLGARLDAAISGALGRSGRSPAPVSTRQTGTRKG
jgi:eukaryotic-like serine/threonine-protein kinase